MSDDAHERSGVDVFDCVWPAMDVGPDEILLTSVDREGTGRGYALGADRAGRRDGEHSRHRVGRRGQARARRATVAESKVNPVCAASIFQYPLVGKSSQQRRRFAVGNIEFLERRLRIQTLGRREVVPTRTRALKRYLREREVLVGRHRS